MSRVGDCLANGTTAACVASAFGGAGIAGDIIGGAVGGVTGFGIQTFAGVSLGGAGAVIDMGAGIEGIRHFLCGGN
jgi:hypothetical protein